ncbi:MAG: hypothetical protein ACE15E_04445 [Acidobacteriota bacterium]
MLRICASDPPRNTVPYSRRVFLALAGASLLPVRAGCREARLVSARPPLFACSLEEFQKGSTTDVVWADEGQGLALKASSEAHYPEAGTYVSFPIRLPDGDRTWRLDWVERWTGPLAWRKHAVNPVLTPDSAGWDKDSLTAPCAVQAGSTFRIYYGSRPGGIGLATAQAYSLYDWKKGGAPVLGAGPAGAFDAGGVNAPEVVPVEGSHWHMYYVGYHRTEKQGGMVVHQIGLAESDDAGLTWRRTSKAPVIPHGDPGSYDAFATSTASVLRVGGRWLMWYGGIAQVPYLGSVCLATSADGHQWVKHPGNPVLSFNPYRQAEAFLVARPHVLHENGVFRMWYSAKGFDDDCKLGEYRVCYAESLDGIHWDRYSQNPVLGPSASGWDHSMVEYAEVLRDGSSYHMWFCGDRYGLVGYAAGEALAAVRVQTRQGKNPTPDETWSGWSAPHQAPAEIRGQTGSFLQIRCSLSTKAAKVTPMVQQLELRA